MFTNITSVLLVGTVLGQLPGTLLLRNLGPQRQVSTSLVPLVSTSVLGASTICNMRRDFF